VDGSGNVYVAGAVSDNAFKITPGGVITQIIDTSGDGAATRSSGRIGLRLMPPAMSTSARRAPTTPSKSPLAA
jgi:hypothetical protein